MRKESMMKDSDIMPYGKYRGIAIANVPADYLIYLYDSGKCYGLVKQYIKDNLEVLNEEIKRRKK